MREFEVVYLEHRIYGNATEQRAEVTKSELIVLLASGMVTVVEVRRSGGGEGPGGAQRASASLT